MFKAGECGKGEAGRTDFLLLRECSHINEKQNKHRESEQVMRRELNMSPQITNYNPLLCSANTAAPKCQVEEKSLLRQLDE